MKTISSQWLANVLKNQQLCQKGDIHHTVTDAYAHLHAFTYFTKISILIHACVVCFHLSTCVCACCLFMWFCLVVYVFVYVCVFPFQVALTCSMHPTVRPKRTSQSLTACAPPPLSPLVLTHVFVSLMTRSLCCFSSVSDLMPVCRYNVSVQAQTHMSCLCM